MDVRLMDVHSFSRGAQRGSQETVAGRSGYVWISDGANEAFEIKRTCRAPASRLREISTWLSDAGYLRFSQEESAAFEARVIRAIEYKRVTPGADPLFEFTVTFSCQPYPLVWPAADPIEITASGAALPNPGTAPALPRVEVVGHGDFSLTIGMQTLFFTGVERGIIVDSEIGDALTADGMLLANECIDGELFRIQPGPNYVSWQLGGADGELDAPGVVEKVIITPRWRWL